MMPEAKVNTTTPGKLVAVKPTEKTKTAQASNPLIALFIFAPFIYLLGLVAIIMVKLLKLGLKKAN